MNNFLEQIDHAIVLTVNGWNSPFLDEIMWFLSAKLTWIPLYLLLIYLSVNKFSTKYLFFFVGIAFLTVGLTDLLCTYGFKHVFLRLRPSHNLVLANRLHLYEIETGEYYRGGLYGFISSHAANFFAFSVYMGLGLKPYYPKLLSVLLFLATVVAFSRLYLGVHYLSDIFVGAAVGFCMGLMSFRIFSMKMKRTLN